MELKNIGIVEAKKLIDAKEISAEELTSHYLQQIAQKDSDIHAFISVNDSAVEDAIKSDKNKKLGGIPIAVKDVFSTKDMRTTCASKILDNYVPAYESTVTKRILDEGAVVIGKANLDEFCHGSSTATSAYFTTKNPYDNSRVAGGSSGGSAAATAADMCAGSLGTETAGSIRQPAAWCGVVGLKPTYGRVPRYGVLAMGSSLDSPGPITKNVDDAAYLLSIIAGKDENDFTSADREVPDYFSNLNPARIKGAKLAIPKEFLELELEAGVRKSFDEAVQILREMGANITEVQMLDPKYAMAVYTIVCRSEVSSNLSRYDGTRYCVPASEQDQVLKYFEEVRGQGFGPEAKRRIMTGTFSLSAGYSDEFFKKAEAVRQMLKHDVLKVLDGVDAIIGPTTPTVALKESETDNPLFGEMCDILIETSSLTGLPGISVPCGLSEALPVGLQFFSRHFEEQLLLDLAKGFENVFGTLKLGK